MKMKNILVIGITLSLIFIIGACHKAQLKPSLPNSTLPETMKIRVGFLPPIDNRPSFEKEGARGKDATIFAASGVSYFRKIGAHARADKNLVLETFPQMGARTLRNVMGAYILQTTHQARAFDEIIPLKVNNFSYKDLPKISRSYDLQYLMTVEIRHFNALTFKELKVLAARTESQSGNTITITSTYSSEARSSATFMVTVLRFKLWSHKNGRTIPVWQTSVRSAYTSNKGEPRAAGGSEALSEALRIYVEKLGRLANHMKH